MVLLTWLTHSRHRILPTVLNRVVYDALAPDMEWTMDIERIRSTKMNADWPT